MRIWQAHWISGSTITAHTAPAFSGQRLFHVGEHAA